jgi:hypothetical protein
MSIRLNLFNKPLYKRLLALTTCASTTTSQTDMEYFLSLQQVSEFLTAKALEKDTFPIDKEKLYEMYIDYCNQFQNVIPVSKRTFTTFLNFFIAQRGEILLNTTLPGRKVILNKKKNGLYPRRKPSETNVQS